MKTCDDYRAMIDDTEGKRHPDLATHLQSCPACADYQATANQTSRLFIALRTALAGSEQTDQAYMAVARRLKQSARQSFWGIAGAVTCALGALGLMARGDLNWIGGLVILLTGVLSAGFAWWSARGRSFFHPLRTVSPDFYQQWTHLLERRMKLTTVVAVIAALELVGGTGVLLFRPDHIDGEILPLMIGFLLVVGVGVLYTFFLDLPALRRELQAVRDISDG